MTVLPIASVAPPSPRSASTCASMMSPALKIGTAAPCCGLSATAVGDTTRSTGAVLAVVDVGQGYAPHVNQTLTNRGFRHGFCLRILRDEPQHHRGRRSEEHTSELQSHDNL